MINNESCSTTNIINMLHYKGEVLMADIRDEIDLCEGIEFNNEDNKEEQVKERQGEEKEQVQVQVSNGENLPIKQGLWERFKVFWFEKIDWNKEIKIELTPHQQKIENEINEFLHQEVTWKKIHDFLFKKSPFGKKKAEI